MQNKNFSAERAPRRTPEEIERLINEFHNSGVTQVQYAAQLGVALSTVARWVRANSQRQSGRKVSKPKFVEVDVRAVSHGFAKGVYQIDLPGGIRIRAEGAWQAEEMRQLLNILQRS
jgi:transposase-like protein